MIFGVRKRKEYDPDYFPTEAAELCREAVKLYTETAGVLKNPGQSLGLTEKMQIEDNLTAVEKALDQIYYEDSCSAKNRKKLEVELLRLQVAVKNILE